MADDKGTVGGLHGKVSTVQMIRLRQQYNDYRIKVETEGGKALPFKEWVEQQRGK
jgi:hypothetical protein